MSSSVKGFFGLILMTAGILIGGLSSLCTLGFTVYFFATVLSSQAGGTALLVPLPLALGAVPMAMGAGLWFAGRALREEKRKPSDPKSLGPLNLGP